MLIDVALPFCHAQRIILSGWEEMTLGVRQGGNEVIKRDVVSMISLFVPCGTKYSSQIVCVP